VVAGQRLLIPAYFYPFGSEWQEMCDALVASRVSAVIIMNPDNGPGKAIDPTYRKVLGHCDAAQQTVIGYVYTSYRRRSLTTVKRDVDRFFRLYPQIAGIFVDEISNETGRAGRTYYRKLYTYIKERRPHALVVGNPGSPATTPWQMEEPAVADVLVIFEGPAEQYRSWAPPGWAVSDRAERYCHLIYASANPAMTKRICAASQKKGAGWVYVTQGVMDNPWDVPPEPAMYRAPSLQRVATTDGSQPRAAAATAFRSVRKL
jgi:Spherulation-specific family 4